MKLEQLVKPLDEMSDEELIERLRQVRHNREVVRPARQAKIDKVEKKTSRAKVSALDKLIDGMSPEEKAKLLEQLASS